MSTKEHTLDKVSFGFWVYILSDCVLFASLFATYAILKDSTFSGPSMEDIVSLPFVLTETFFLLTSSFSIGLARVFAIDSHKKKTVLLLLGVTLLLGLAFLGMELTEFSNLINEGSGPDKSAFLSAFFTLVGTHGAHVFFGSLWMLVLMTHIWRGGINDGTTRKLTILSLFWHFLDIIWIFIFTFVYLIGAL
jgi:cytochrome o ubiquinol oxidase subunit 3